MTAILAIQALVFQDGGILALGANVTNMAVAGTLAGYLPFHFWGAGRWRKASIFLGGLLSVLVSAVLALAQLLISGVSMPASVLGISLGLFVVSAALEGAITLAVVQALEAINPGFVRKPESRVPSSWACWVRPPVLLAVVGVLFASTQPDGIEKLVQTTGISGAGQSAVQHSARGLPGRLPVVALAAQSHRRTGGAGPDLRGLRALRPLRLAQQEHLVASRRPGALEPAAKAPCTGATRAPKSSRCSFFWWW